MGRIYHVTFEAQSVSAAQDLLEISNAATVVLKLHKVSITQEVSETSEQLALRLIRRTAAGTGGAAVTPAKTSPGDPAAVFSAARNVTTPGTAGDVLPREGQNVLNGWLMVPTPEEAIYIAPSGRLGINLPTAPTAALTMSGYAIVEEIG